MTRRFITLSIALLPLFGPGCSSPGGGSGEQAPPQAGVLQEVADILRGNTRPNGRGPTKLAELNGSQSLFPRGYQAIKSGEVVVIWGVGVKGEEEKATGGDVVAYEKDAPTNGGYVVLTSGEVKKMTAAEFAAAPKAK